MLKKRQPTQIKAKVLKVGSLMTPHLTVILHLLSRKVLQVALKAEL
jgi:hypothetical protein